MKKRVFTVFTVILLAILLIPGSAFAIPSGSTAVSSDRTLHGNLAAGTLTVSNSSNLNVNGCGLEIGKKLTVKSGSKITGGTSDYGVIFFSEGASSSGMDLYIFQSGLYTKIKGGVGELWKSSRDYNVSEGFWWDKGVKAFVLKGVSSGHIYDTDTAAAVLNPNEENTERILALKQVINPKQAKVLSSKTRNGVKNTKITAKAYSGKIAGGGRPHTNISWTKSKGYSLDGYIIYRSTSKSGKYKQIAVLYKPELNGYRDADVTSGKTYYYKIKGFRYGTDKNGSNLVKDEKYLFDGPADGEENDTNYTIDSGRYFTGFSEVVSAAAN